MIYGEEDFLKASLSLIKDSECWGNHKCLLGCSNANLVFFFSLSVMTGLN